MPTPPALRDFNPIFVRFGSKADIAPCLDFVRFTPESGQSGRLSICPPCAKSGHNAVQRRPGLTRGFDLINNGYDLPPFMSPVINRR